MVSRIKRTALALLLSLAAAGAWAQQAFTNRATELKEQASPTARTLDSLAANTEVKVVSRGSGWTKVEAGGKAGWVNVFHLRFPATASSDSGGSLLSGLSSAIGGRPKSQQAGIQTVGVRGLSPDELKNASPDAESLKRMQSYAADKAAAERFAREGKLADVKIDYNEGARK
jgi:uncharacterized protein YgiM (DUF1202 family)